MGDQRRDLVQAENETVENLTNQVTNLSGWMKALEAQPLGEKEVKLYLTKGYRTPRYARCCGGLKPTGKKRGAEKEGEDIKIIVRFFEKRSSGPERDGATREQ